jgi:hypothetical protein
MRQQLAVNTVNLQFAKDMLTRYKQSLSDQKAQAARAQGGGPQNWGITVKQVAQKEAEWREPLKMYCAVHKYANDGSFTHVCMCNPCPCNHGCAKHRAAEPEDKQEEMQPVQPNMHTVVDVFIKPETAADDGLRGLALTLNSEKPEKVKVFVSHSWNAKFEDMVTALTKNMLPEVPVFICSFAIPQNLDVGTIVGSYDLERTPFAIAHNVAEELCLIVDNKSVDVLSRVWVIYEMYLSLCRGKPINIGAPHMSLEMFEAIESKIKGMDVRSATASNFDDLETIMRVIEGKEDEINAMITNRMRGRVHVLKNMLP